jgi:hypothetical protein
MFRARLARTHIVPLTYLIQTVLAGDAIIPPWGDHVLGAWGNQLRRLWSGRPATEKTVSWAPPHDGEPNFTDLSEEPDQATIPRLDHADIDESSLNADQLSWRREGVVIKRGFLAPEVLQPYIVRRLQLRDISLESHRAGWSSPTPYEHVEELRALSLHPPLMHLMESLIGEPMLLHLNLTGWVSTERNWHQDDYLNPAGVNSWYAAVWIALGPIHDEAGPFEYIPGSHRWPLLRQEKVKGWMSPEELSIRTPDGDETWPKASERFVVPAIEHEIAARAGTPKRFLAEMGDILIWHGRLLHRGTKPVGREYWRPALIAHYSGINHRPDMPGRAYDDNGFAYALFDIPLR